MSSVSQIRRYEKGTLCCLCSAGAFRPRCYLKSSALLQDVHWLCLNIRTVKIEGLRQWSPFQGAEVSGRIKGGLRGGLRGELGPYAVLTMGQLKDLVCTEAEKANALGVERNKLVI